MEEAFYGAENLQVPATDTPDFSAVTNMFRMFDRATAANPDTSGWDTAAVTNMSVMFADASLANPDTSNWDTSAVTNMAAMFANASLANPDTSNWNTSAVISMSSMFQSAASFDQDIGSWDVTSLTNALGMFTGVTLSTSNYDSLLIGWDAQSLNMGVVFAGGNSTYCSAAAVTARANMIAQDAWVITDGGLCPLLTNGDFVSTWQTNNVGTSNATSITVPMVGGPYDVDWNNDGNFDEFNLAGPVTHDFGVAGTVTIGIQGSYDSIRFGGGGDRLKILSIHQWGTNPWTTMNGAFSGAGNLQIPALDTPDFSAVTDMSSMFANASLANPDTSNWNTSVVTNMGGMFNLAGSANPDTSSWNTSAVTNMAGMFRAAGSAKPDTSGWDTSAVTDMGAMFLGASSANPDTSGWDTSAVTSMRFMFQSATSFDRDIGSWDVTSLTDATDMFAGITLSTTNYDSLLVGWDAQALNMGVPFNGGLSKYCSAPAVLARANIIAEDNWLITDGGVCPPDDNIFADGFEGGE